MPPVMECVANVSEGRRDFVLDELASVVAAVPGIMLRDFSWDRSHNRSVLTMIGGPGPLEAAVVAIYQVAVGHIDLREHHGVHPRIGAVDVVPFVPLHDTSMRDCIDLARRVGKRVADTFSVPIYLYGEAATRPERRALEHVRRGEFEGLQDKMARPEWRPDFGPSTPHPTAGASAVGARNILIAFNVNLHTSDVAIARRIAGIIRERDGGLPGVKALGLQLPERGIAQVSVNLVDVTATPLHVVFDRIAAEAERAGVSVADSEVVGLVPAQSLHEAARHALRLARFSASQILETADPRTPPSAGREPLGET